MAFYFGRWL